MGSAWLEATAKDVIVDLGSTANTLIIKGSRVDVA